MTTADSSTTTSAGTRQPTADNVGLDKTSRAEDFQRMVLRETLALAVPMHMRELAGLPAEHLAAIASNAATITGTHGDDLQYGGKHCREAFNALARGLAAAALVADGGVDYAGLHWCANPHCRATHRYDHADDQPEPPPKPRRRPRPIEDVHLPEPQGETA